MRYDAIIIGGGAAGLAAGVSLARAGWHTAVLEAQPRVGRKLLSTGNGRCNFTNINASAEDYFGDAALAAAALAAFPPAKILAFFASIGVPARVDAEGRAYPASNMAASVLDALRLSFAEAGGEEVTGFRVRALSRELVATAEDGRTAAGRCALLATGGSLNYSGYSSTEMDNLISATASAQTAEELSRLYSEIQLRVVDELPFLGLLFRAGTVLSTRSLGGLSGIRAMNAFRGLEYLTDS